MRPLRVGLVGAGRWATVHHLPGLAAHPDAGLVAVHDLDPDRAKAVADRFGGLVADGVEALVDRVDAVIVASPPAAHHQAAMAALDRGRAVLVEKPMTISAEDAWDLTRRSEETGTPLMVGYTFELTPTSRQVVDAVGQLGELLLVDGMYASAMRHLFDGTWPFDTSDPLTVPRPETFADPQLSGGGQARGQLTHLLASALRAVGVQPLAASAQFRPRGAELDLHDVVAIDFGDFVASFASTCALTTGHPPVWELRYVGAHGTVFHDLASGAASIRLDGRDLVQLPALPADERYPSRAVVQRFVDVVLGKAENPAPGRLGAEVVAILAAAYDSAAAGGSPRPVPQPTRSPAQSDAPATTMPSDRGTNHGLARFPGYRPGSPPQYAEYHAEVDFLDEIEAIWGSRWGAQGIGRLREVAMSPPTAVEVLAEYEEDPAFFIYDGRLPDLGKMQAQHAGLRQVYEELGIEVRIFEYPETPRSAYGPLKRAVSAAAGFVINGGAIVAREAAPYWRGRSRYVSQFLQSIGCPILYTVHGKGVCEGGAFTRMADDFIVAMLSTDCNRDGLDQVRPILERAGYHVWVAHSPGPLHTFHPELIGWIHADMWIAPLDRDLALIYPPWCDYETIRYLKSIGYQLVEADREEQETLAPANMITIEPRKVVMPAGAPRTRAAVEAAGVEVIEVDYDEVIKYGGSIRCTTMQLQRDSGPNEFG